MCRRVEKDDGGGKIGSRHQFSARRKIFDDKFVLVKKLAEVVEE